MTRQRIQLRRGTAAEWLAANPVLLAGEAGIETDTRKIKIGDGATAWSSLVYFIVGSPGDYLRDLLDVTATNPVNGSVLAYNESEAKFVASATWTTSNLVDGANF